MIESYQIIKDERKAKEIDQLLSACFSTSCYESDEKKIVSNINDSDNFILYGSIVESKLISLGYFQLQEYDAQLLFLATEEQFRKFGIAGNILDLAINDLSADYDSIYLYCLTDKLEYYYQEFGFKTEKNELINSYNCDTKKLQRKMRLYL